MRLFVFISLFCVFYINSVAQNSVKERKVALVVGVSNYEHANQLKNTLNDANDISTKLSLLGFDVTKLLDAENKTINSKIDSLTKKLTSSDVFVFFFSGHGAEYNGENYLFLRNSNPTAPSDMPYETYPVGKLLGKLDYAKVKTNILILDACRSNPFVKSWDKSGLVKEGLVNIDAPSGTFIGFAASPGKTASDGIRKNGTYTEAILKQIELKNITIDELFNKVNKEVRIQSNGKQIPFKNSSLEDNFYFNKTNISDNKNGENMNPNTVELKFVPINRPKFPLPKIVKGYINDNINSFGLASINKTTFDRNEFIELTFSLTGKNIWDVASPVYIDITQRTSGQSIYQVYSEQFQPTDKLSNFRISSSFPAGTYELSIGFYLISELNQEYPTLYNKKFSITIL